MAHPPLVVVLNYRSPFCALAIERLFELGRHYRVAIEWRIVRDVPRPSSLPITEENPRFSYNRQDCKRRADWLGLPWNPPSWRIGDVVSASRLGQWLLKSGSPLFEAFSVMITRAYWSDGHDISDATVVDSLARSVGVSDAELKAAAAATEEMDQQLADNAHWSSELGVLGAPFVMIADQRFWGSDRLDAVERHLADLGLGPHHGPFGEGVLFGSTPVPLIPVAGREAGVAINRIFCVGRNYADHAREMGFEANREAPFFFMKAPDALVLSRNPVSYPPGTGRYEYEMELVVILGEAIGRVTPEAAGKAIFGYAAGLDMTRRDLQLAAREKGRPWELGKAFEQSAVIGPIRRASDLSEAPAGSIQLSVNGEVKQKAEVRDMIWTVPEIISNLSEYYDLKPGDIIFTGTPAGVGPVVEGDELYGTIEGVGEVSTRIVAASTSDEAQEANQPVALSVQE